MHTIKPLDREAVHKAIDEIGRIITVEDHNVINGLGSAVCEVASELGKGIVSRIGYAIDLVNPRLMKDYWRKMG
jgi:transketolase